MANIQPLPGMIDSVRNQGMGWTSILSEFIDNAFDASATRVEIFFNDRTLKIVDDGIGCDDPIRMLTLGGRKDHSTTWLGRYGIGAKDAAISAADAIIIETTHKGVYRVASCNWRKLEKASTWDIDDPDEAATADPSGTVITLSPTRMKKIGDHAELVKYLSMTYAPAIRQGRQIIVKPSAKAAPIPVPVYELPELEHVIRADLNVDGKAARITMGLVPEGHAVVNSGVTISYKYRVIKTGDRIGLGDSPTPRLCGWLELSKEWNLTKHKNGITSDVDALGKEIARVCSETISIAQSQAHDIMFDSLSAEISAAIAAATNGCPGLKDRKAKRSSPVNATGARLPAFTGVTHKRAKRSQVGATFSGNGKGAASTIRVAFQSMGADGPAFKYEKPVVYINRDIPEIEKAKDHKELLAAHSIYAASVWFATDRLDSGALFKSLEYIEAGDTFQRITRIAAELFSKLPQ